MRKLTAYSDADNKPLSLGDDSAGDKISVGLPVAEGITQESRPPNAAFTKRYDRKLITNTLVWTVDRDHGTESKALDFIRDHGQAVIALGICALQDSGPGINDRWWNNASIKPKCVRHDGQSTLFEYSLRAGRITANKLPLT